MNEVITSLQNPQVKTWRSLNKSRAARLEAGLFLAEGEHMAGEALKEHKARALLIDERARERYSALAENVQGVSVYYLAAHVMEALCDAKTPQGVIAVCNYPAETALSNPGDFLVALDGVQDPGNVGTVLRTAAAFSVGAVVLTGDCADLYSPKTVRATMGAIFRQRALCLDRTELPAWLEKNGLKLYGAALSPEARDLREVDITRSAVAVGSEGRGLSRELLELCSDQIIIPMDARSESLNAAVAASVIMWEMSREKR